MKFAKLLSAISFGAALSLSMTAYASDYKAEYKVSTVLGKPFPWGEAAEKWAELVAERTEGRINLKVYPNAQLVSGDQTKEFTAMRQGIIDMAVGSTINWSPQVKELNLFSLPFLMPDYAAMDALTQGPVGVKIFEAIEDKGITPIAWSENGFREVSNSKRPITEPADLEGLKMRVVGSPLYNDTFTALGANPTQMSWADAKPALTTGAVDGQENPLTVYDVAKIETVGQTYVTQWHYVADPLIFASNERVWANFTPEDQAILKQAAVDAGAYGIELARKGTTAEDQSLIKALEARGAQFTELTSEQRQKFVDATRDVYGKWKDRIGSDLVDLAEKSIADRP